MFGFWGGVIGTTVLSVAMYFAWTRLHPVAALFLVPFLGWFASRALVEFGFALPARMRARELARWNGRYYYFGDRHFPTLEDGELLFRERDILEFIGQPDSTTVSLFAADERRSAGEDGETFLTQKGCERLLMKCPHPEAKKMLIWMRREVFAPYERKQGRL